MQRAKSIVRNKKKQKILKKSFILVILAQLWLEKVTVTLANPCPVETPLYGGATLDGSSDEIN